MTARVPKNVLLDLDGTLVDPRNGFIASIRYALHSLGQEGPDDDTLASHIGPPLHETLRGLLGESHAGDVTEAVRLFREHYADEGILEQTLYAGVPHALEQLRQSGARLVLATSKPRIFAQRILDRFELTGLFFATHGSELDGTRANKAELIRYILEQESLAPEDAVMIGDRAQDIHAARKNDLSSIGALWGYGAPDELVRAGATAVCGTPSGLPDAVMEIRCLPVI